MSTSKGSIITDAALVLPIFILAVLLIFSLIREAAEESRLYKDLCTAAGKPAVLSLYAEANVDYLTKSGKTDTYDIQRTVYYRPFCGESEDSEYAYSLVCIYPKAGIKYHRKRCSTVENNSNYVTVTLKEAEEAGYLPCKLCYGGPDYFK